MRNVEVMADLVGYLTERVREEIGGLLPEELAWRPDTEGNSIAITVWHFSRWLDLLRVRALLGRPRTEEQWYTRGWAGKTGYDPAGIGYAGLGALTGYSRAEVAAVPLLSREDLLAYLDQTCDALRAHLLALPEGALDEPAPGLGQSRTIYSWLRAVLMGCFGHVGEIEALKTLRVRAQAEAAR